jgi:hypothetical protein
MYLRHGPVNAPLGTESAPATDELLFGFCKVHVVKISTLSEVSKYIENKIDFLSLFFWLIPDVYPGIRPKV